uniref:Uncharacterized protein n=1 Tax=Medicago truncatula TaxID=3880 RepID=A2Q4K9_MEDTR|nr:hypothetical protein MtrDRAFT_AC157503g32v2 [Medicago truncatula]
MVNIGGGFWAHRHAQFLPIWRDFLSLSNITAPQSGRYGRILALRHWQHCSLL